MSVSIRHTLFLIPAPLTLDPIFTFNANTKHRGELILTQYIIVSSQTPPCGCFLPRFPCPYLSSPPFVPAPCHSIAQMITRMKENSGVLTLIGVGCLGLGALTAREIMDIRAKIKADRALARAQAIQAAGGVSGGKADKETKPKREKMPGSVGVNASFARRLMYILRIVIPGVLSKESLILITQVCPCL